MVTTEEMNTYVGWATMVIGWVIGTGWGGKLIWDRLTQAKKMHAQARAIEVQSEQDAEDAVAHRVMALAEAGARQWQEIAEQRAREIVQGRKDCHERLNTQQKLIAKYHLQQLHDAARIGALEKELELSKEERAKLVERLEELMERINQLEARL